MANTFNLGNGNWAQKTEKLLAYNAENDNYKPLPFDFDRASTATRVNKQGLIETVGVDEPRIDFLNDSKGALLLEPSRTNYVLYSETEGIIYGLNGWSGDSDSTITQNYGTTPFNGSELKSTRIQFTGSSKQLRNNFSSVTIIPTCSIWIKGSVGKTIKFGSNGNEGVFTLNGEWQKLVQTGSSSSTNRLTINTYSDTTARDIEIFAPQVEGGSYSTSIIPTQGSAVTRSADTCNNGANEQVINSTEGVLYVETSKINESEGEGTIAISRDLNNEIRLNFATNNRLNVFVNVGGSNQVYMDNTNYNLEEYNKIAIKYKLNDYSVFVNGSKIHTDTNATVPSGLKLVDFNQGTSSNKFYGKTKDLKVYNTALTDAELIALTS